MVYFGSSLPAPLLFAAMVIGSVLAGAIWAFVPAWFKSRWNTNETLFTLMMNYVATSIVACMTNIMRGQASSLGTLNKATKAGWLPVINGQRYTINIIVVLVLTFAMYAYLKYSKQGYEISVVGESENTARYAGINVSRVMIRTMLLSGAICGLCGFLVVAGKDQTISTTSAGGNGFRHYCGLAGKVQHLLYDADFFPADLPGPWRFGNCFCIFPERICSGYHHRHYPVLYPGQRIFHQLPPGLARPS